VKTGDDISVFVTVSVTVINFRHMPELGLCFSWLRRSCSRPTEYRPWPGHSLWLNSEY